METSSEQKKLSLDFSADIEAAPENGRADDLSDKKLDRVERNLRFYVKWGAVGVLCLCGLLLVGTYVLNLVLSSDCRWLSESQMSEIKDFVTAIIAGLLMSLSIKFVAK